LEVQLGYLYKNLAQSFPDARHRNRYARLSLSVFERFQDSPDANVRASALNGLGNIFLILDKPSKAAEYIRGALAIAPDYGYAWNDLFAAQAALAERGKLDLEEMREALKQMKRYWADDVLKALYIKDCERTLRSWERGARKGLPKNITTRR
jgi:tetratricopeptide (TPR) repeat protein